MNRVPVYLILTITGLQLIQNVMSETESCDNQKAAGCFKTVMETTTDCLLYDATTRREELDNCMTQYINLCDGLTVQQWQSNIDEIIANFAQNCNTACDESAQELEVCDSLYSGLAILAQEIISTNVQPTDTKCAIGLKRVYVCMINATRTCKTQETSALEKIQAESAAFKQCNIVIQQPTVPATNGTTSNSTSSQTDETTSSNSTKIVLYALLGVSALVVGVAAIIALLIWIRKIRHYNYIKGKQEPAASDHNMTTLQRQNQDDPYFVRDRSPRRSQQYKYGQNNEAERFNSIGPFGSGNRWWTRPGFGQYGNEGVQTRPF